MDEVTSGTHTETPNLTEPADKSSAISKDVMRMQLLYKIVTQPFVEISAFPLPEPLDFWKPV
ncbi:hypothetical protein RUM43_014208, partial [Polyplax serrata]